MENKMGPRIDPWGTPNVRGVGSKEDTDSVRFTRKLLSDLN